MVTSNNPYTFPVPHQDQPSFNQNYMQQPMPNPEDITDPTTEMNMALALMAKAFKLNYSTPINNNQRISLNPRNRQIAQPGMNMGQDRQMQMVEGNGENQFREYAGQNIGNLNGYNAVQNVRNQVAQNVIQNPRVQNIGNQNGLIVVPGTNQNPNGNGNLVAARAEEETLQLAQESRQKMKQLNKEIKPSNYTKINYLSGVFVSQTAKSREELYFSNASKTANVSKPISIPNEEFSDDTTPSVERKFLNEIEQLQAQLGDLKGKSKDTSCVSDTLNPLSRKLENENMELEFQVLNYAKENARLKTTYKNLFDSISMSQTQTKTIIASLQNELQSTIPENSKLRAELLKKVYVQKDNTRGTSTNTKFVKQSILGKPPKLGVTHALSKPVTSNSITTPQESKFVKNNKE
nr:hypothetical protein [Tanacetum cinerariifolium]